jgi:V/A-type H+-transporting ATPase subunit I
MAQGVAEHAGLGFLLAGLIIVVGHAINIVLAIMSGVVHGLRLNCIEFFDWSLKEEGYSFQAFRKKAESSWTT